MTTLSNVWVASYGFQFCDPIGLVHAPTREECLQLLDEACQEEAELWADQESDDGEEADPNDAPIVCYGPFFETSIEIED